MKWTYFIQQKLKVAVLLMAAMLLVILFNIMERRNIEEMNRSVTSIYNDRLIPAADIFYITDHLYNKRFLLEKFLETDALNQASVKADLAKHDQSIAKLISQFEKTYLVDKESAFLNEFKHLSSDYARLENKVLQLSVVNKEGARAFYEAQGRQALTGTISKLAELTKVQTTVGSELLNNSRGIVASSDMLSSLQIVLAIVIGVMIISLVNASKVTSTQEHNFNLN